MKLYISVINHGHDELITSRETLTTLAKDYAVIIRSNTPPTDRLSQYAINAAIHLIHDGCVKGFAANNNAVFDYCENQLGMTENDYFLVLNPDVDIASESLEQLLSLSKARNSDISAINLFRDEALTIYDNSIRHYHQLLAPLKSLLGIKRKDIYDKDAISTPIEIDWAAGSFLLFKAECFSKLEGFDEKYFMYFEDADLCTRANRAGYKVTYFPSIKAIHLASHQNRKMLSKHFGWYVKSLLRYHINSLKYHPKKY
ncbi:glycosyltransferase family 2 protein [Vibrio cholerae]|uniref:galactosyltransferase-related protein n=1 Tax=Vibrio cholerae TaxID=666 RepID=UPI000B489F15|nr:glycosyltransferase family 2 protein [Vibrio cholerae]EGQ9612962.1 glycosyltransferase family 2 protein [Vibrio cholerae]EGR4458267.1 glycosyltransferase family 2 protein [Vibrio cholerae]EGR5448061.1 glycosyltransferase family 2 protein [Vibrio cholerae]EGR5456058.1 glycosyltransferase family 2 protein [Vibrio cholerae]EGR5464089.1 glycosyltransferase family 2 protein [Vibrio cholerae]